MTTEQTKTIRRAGARPCGCTWEDDPHPPADALLCPADSPAVPDGAHWYSDGCRTLTLCQCTGEFQSDGEVHEWGSGKFTASIGLDVLGDFPTLDEAVAVLVAAVWKHRAAALAAGTITTRGQE